jgi:hypothetical protein
MEWQVMIRPGAFNMRVYIFQLLNDRGDMRIMRPGADGTWTIEESLAKPSIDDPVPSFSFSMRDAPSIMRGFASELATHGFATLDPGGVSKAKDAHIASVERQAERLFVLAGGMRVTAGSASIERKE